MASHSAAVDSNMPWFASIAIPDSDSDAVAGPMFVSDPSPCMSLSTTAAAIVLKDKQFVADVGVLSHKQTQAPPVQYGPGSSLPTQTLISNLQMSGLAAAASHSFTSQDASLDSMRRESGRPPAISLQSQQRSVGDTVPSASCTQRGPPCTSFAATRKWTLARWCDV